MSIKVCHMTSVHKRYDGRIFQRECVSLSESGYEVYLVVADDMPDEIKDGVHILSTGVCSSNRIERMTKASRSVFDKAKEVSADVYHFHDPELFPYALKLKKIGKKVIFDSHEDTVEQIRDKKYLIFPKVASRLYAKYQKRNISKLDAVIVVSPNYKSRFDGFANVYMVTNFPRLKPIPERNNTNNQICFTGGCDPLWCNERIAEAVSELDCEYLMAGPGDKRYINSVIDKGKGHVKYLGILSFQDSQKLQADSLIGAMVNDSAQLIRNGGTIGNTKMFEYMMNGLPILCSDVKLWRDIVEKYNCGVCVDPFNVESIRAGIETILDDKIKAKQMGENGRKAVELEYNWEETNKELLRLYNDILNEGV